MLPFGRRPIQRLDFVVAGAQKSGTTALNYYLKRHRQIALPHKKELHFFDNDKLFARATIDYSDLHQQFAPARQDAIAGENTPNYLYWPPAMARIHTYNPAIKLIILLRNPITRAFSQWNMQRARGVEPLDFADAIRAEPSRIKKLPQQQLRKFAYIDRGRYAIQLKRVFDLFARKQVLTLKYEQFRAHQHNLVDQVFHFLRLSPIRFRPIEAHDIPYQRQITPNERLLAGELLHDEICRVEEMLEWDCADWL
jgi:hypothetical protein